MRSPTAWCAWLPIFRDDDVGLLGEFGVSSWGCDRPARCRARASLRQLRDGRARPGSSRPRCLDTPTACNQRPRRGPVAGGLSSAAGHAHLPRSGADLELGDGRLGVEGGDRRCRMTVAEAVSLVWIENVALVCPWSMTTTRELPGPPPIGEPTIALALFEETTTEMSIGAAAREFHRAGHQFVLGAVGGVRSEVQRGDRNRVDRPHRSRRCPGAGRACSAAGRSAPASRPARPNAGSRCRRR